MDNIPSGTPETDEAGASIVSLRGAVILLLGFVAGCVTAGLTYAAHRRLAEAVLAGLAAAGVAVWWFDRFVD